MVVNNGNNQSMVTGSHFVYLVRIPLNGKSKDFIGSRIFFMDFVNHYLT